MTDLPQIYLTQNDMDRLLELVEAQSGKGLENLENELVRAHVVPRDKIPEDVVTMNSEMLVRDLDSGNEMTFTLVFPSAADLERGRISVLAPVGTALLGYRVGDTIEWKVPGRVRRLCIEKILYQPEAAGDYDR